MPVYIRNTGLVYFAISKKGEKPIDGVTDTNPEGLTSVTGKWAADFAQRLHSSDLTCHVLERNEWEIKMVWSETTNFFSILYYPDGLCSLIF